MAKQTHKIFETLKVNNEATASANTGQTANAERIPANLLTASLADRIIRHMESKKYHISRNPGEVNIVYLEGADADGKPNTDAPDGWNDRRIVIVFEMDGNLPVIVHNAQATTEPGVLATNSEGARRRGGVARVQFGQFAVWQVGYHNERRNGRLHPALVQRRPLKVHRDANRDGKRTGDALDFASGINQHSTRPNVLPARVDNWSEGCLVGRSWIEHEQFMALVKADPRYKADAGYFFHTAIIPARDIWGR